MRVAVAGGTGLVGQPLVKALLDRGDSVVVIGRSKARILEVFGDVVQAETYDTLSTQLFSEFDAVANLVGENVGSAVRWTSSTMKEILESRLQTTSALAKLVAADGCRARFLSASGISVYGHQEEGDTVIKDEDAAIPESHSDFLTDVSIKWEAVARCHLPANRLVLLRIGVVLCPGAGALGKMEMPFRFGMGGRMGSGSQCMSWISLDDVVRALVFLLDNPDVSGPVNLVSGFVPQISFAQALASALHRPCFLPAPSFALKLVLGADMAKALVLSSHRVEPARLKAAGFAFGDVDIGTTLERLYNPLKDEGSEGR